MERVRLDQHALQIQFTEQLPQQSPLMVFAGGVAGLADRHTQRGRIQHDLCNERRLATSGGLNGAPERLAVTDQLIEIPSAPLGISATVQSRIPAHKAATSTWWMKIYRE